MIEFYTKGRGHEVKTNEHLRIHWHIWEPHLTSNEMDRLVDFVKTLTDEGFKPRTPEHVPSGISIKATGKEFLSSIKKNSIP
jgi:cytochrome c peroxidase